MMVGTSKILTVSYGTFSCTLEGFDDSFETMKAIAEYFRDLAADDRYFGAEPPTPDAEMLARIAEREISRRVEARQEEGRIVLRAGDAQALKRPDTRPDEAEIGTGEAETPDAAVAAAETSADAEEAAAEETADTAVAAPELAADADEAAAEETADTAVAAPELAADAGEAAAEETADTAVAAPELAADAGEAAAEETADMAVATPAARISAPEEDNSIAAKLRRIRSVVSMSSMSFRKDEYSEDEHAQDVMEAAVTVEEAGPAEPAAELPDLQAFDDGAPAGARDALPEAAATPSDARGSAEGQEDTPGSDAMTDEDGDARDNVFLARDTLAQLLADALSEDQADTARRDDDPGEDELAALLSDAQIEPGERQHLDARVVKVKRSALDETLREAGLEEEDARDTGDEDTPNMFADMDEDAAGAESPLSPEDEADLQRELAEVEAELVEMEGHDGEERAGSDGAATEDHAAEAPQEDAFELPQEDAFERDAARTDEDGLDEVGADAERADEDDAGSAAQDPRPHPARGIEKLGKAGDSDLTRIFEETGNQLDQPESNQRRRAIQHLRAAVAATRAEERGREGLAPDADETPYRSDLASAVRPRRPRPGEAARSARPAGSRPAPLKLVAEQRVDMPQEPVRPRRVSALDLNVDDAGTGTDSSFADYAEEMGATALPDLLEAAAAYMSDVEGRPQFSRPMLMGKLKEVEKDGFSREDGLRSFGQLLRQGKLQKIRGGRFTVTEQTDFRAESRHAG